MKVLLVEDKKDIRTQLLDTWPRENLKLTVASDTATANGYLSQEEFDAVLIDLNLDDAEGEYSGIPFGAKLREQFPAMLIVMYSGYIESGNEKGFRYYAECLDAGADQVLSRPWLGTKTPKQVAEALRSWREQRLGKFRSHVDLEHADDLKLNAIFERLGGREVLKDTLRKLFPGIHRFRIEPIGGGYSGAFLLRIKTFSDDASAGSSNVVKVSRSEFALSTELKRKPFQGSHLDKVGVSPRMDRVEKVGSWFAFSVRDVGQAMTLEEYVLEKGTSAPIVSRLRAMVQELLVENARASNKAVDDEHKTRFELKFSFLSDVMDALDDTSRFAETLLDAEYKSRIDDLRKFLTGIEMGFYSMAAGDVHVAFLHGDFHCRNVLLPESPPTPIVIDFGRSDVYPRLFDFSSLEVDLMIRVLDSDSGRVWDPKRVKKWWDHIDDVYPLGDKDLRPGTAGRVNSLRQCLHDALQEDLEHVSRREYTEAVLFQLLRYIRFPTISMAKKALAARWAAELSKSLGR